MVFSRPGLVWEAEIINSVLLLLAGWWCVCTLHSLFVVESLFLTCLVLLAPFFFWFVSMARFAIMDMVVPCLFYFKFFFFSPFLFWSGFFVCSVWCGWELRDLPLFLSPFEKQ